MKHLTLTFIFLYLISFLAIGQGKLNLSLSEAQEFALEHNKSLLSARLDVESSELKLKESIAQGLPQVDAAVDWMTYFGYEIPFSFGSGEPPTQDQISASMNNIMTQFPGITQQDFYVYNAMQAFEQTFIPEGSNTIKMTDASTAKIQLGQLIYSGQYWVGIKVAKLGQKIAKQGLESSILDIKEAVTNSYYMVLVTQQSIETFKLSIESLNKVKGHTQAMYENGMAEQTDVDQISIQVTMLENNLRSMERGLQMIYSMLKFQLGIDPTEELVLTENIDGIIAILNPTSGVGDFDISLNTTFQLLETQEAISAKMIEMEKMAYAPTLSGFFAYNQKLLTTGFDMTPKTVAGFTMNVPVFSSGTRKHRVEKAKIELDKVQLNKSMVQDQLMIQNTQLLLDLKTAIENYDSQKENVNIAKRVYENIQNKYEQGMASSLDLTQSNSNYLQAESNYIQSLMSLLQAKVAIDKLHNQL